MIRVEHGDCREIIPTLGATVDAVVTDPPYHLSQMHKRFSAERAAIPQLGRDGAHRRMAAGFMGQQWDGGDIGFRPETWATIGAALRPGGFLVAFGGTRTYHRMACAIEDAGFVIQDTIAWLYGSGFPKNRAMLKPAFEPIVLAYKPGGKRTMQVDECRISTADKLGGGGNTTPMPEGWDRPYRHDPEAIEFNKRRTAERIAKAETLGRWPANICHDGSDEVVAAFPELGKSTGGRIANISQTSEIYGGGKGLGQRDLTADDVRGDPGYGDSGSAARFFFSAKAGAQDRWGSRHPTVKPVELMKWLVALVCPPGGTVLDPFAGSGTTAVAALGAGRNAILIEREDQYVADIRERVAFYEGGGMHSMQAKNRHRKIDHGPLFAEPAFDAALDCKLSFDAAIQAVGEQVKGGSPPPTDGYFGEKT